MALRERKFSDLILLAEAGRGLLKGAPGHDQQLVPVPDEDRDDIAALHAALRQAYEASDAKRDPKTGQNRHPDTFRIEHDDVRYRVAAFSNVDTAERIWFLRRLADVVPDIESIGLLPPIATWLTAEGQSQGLVLISGAQGSGKTTTAGALIKARLTKFGGHAVTFENPVEMPLSGPHGSKGYCFQTEISGEDELADHIERAHRFGSPDIIHIGEIRTKYAATEALRISLGSRRQMVVATIHGLDVVATLDRLLTWAREIEGEAAKSNLQNALLAVIHQDLASENGRRVLRCPEFLLVPFKDGYDGIRAKLREGHFKELEQDMTEQANRIDLNGIDKFL